MVTPMKPTTLEMHAKRCTAILHCFGQDVHLLSSSRSELISLGGLFVGPGYLE